MPGSCKHPNNALLEPLIARPLGTPAVVRRFA